MLIGYARTSTVEQIAGLDSQIQELHLSSCTKIFSERVSSVAEREQLNLALDYLRDDDTLIVTKLDRLARSMRDLISIVDRIEAAGASLRILSLSLDTSTPTGKLMLNMLGAVAQFEREIMLERQREGIAKAKAEGAYKGRKPTAAAKAAEVISLKRAGVGPVEISRRLNISRSSIHRILSKQ